MANILLDHANWEFETPMAWNGTAFVIDLSDDASGRVWGDYNGTSADGDSITGQVTIADRDGFDMNLVLIAGGIAQAYVPLTNGGTTEFNFVLPYGSSPGTFRLIVATEFGNTAYYYYGLNATVAPPAAPVDDPWNCECDCSCGCGHATILEIYQRVMRRMGYANQINNPPPGVKEAVYDYINQAQRLVIADFDEIQEDRFFTWDMEEGQSKFGVCDNRDACEKKLRAISIKAVYVKRDLQIWRLDRGINPLWKSGGVNNSWPTHYDVRQCIEVYPPPSEPMELTILGKVRHIEMVEDGDPCIVDAEAIFLRTVALYKTDKGHANAGTYAGQYTEYIGNINADMHRDHRWVPYIDMGGWRRDRLTRVMDPLVYGGD